jgi:hypothetical protein
MNIEERTLIAVKKETHKKFKLYCVENGLVMSDLTTKIIEEYLNVVNND